MENPYYAFTVPVFMNTLTALKQILKKGEEYATAKGKSDAEMLALKLAADMFPLAKQVQMACDNAKGASARLSGSTAPKMEDNEATFAELSTRIDKTIAYLDTLSAEDFNDAATATIKMPYFPEDSHFIGDGYARFYALPNFFFHVVTAYDILRANGVALGKGDYAGNLPLIKD
jgi:hypothetical protein